MRRATSIAWRMRTLGFLCGLGMSLSLMAIGQALPHEANHFDLRDFFQYIITPVMGLMIGALGWFGRDAYARLRQDMDAKYTALAHAIQELSKQQQAWRESMLKDYLTRSEWKEDRDREVHRLEKIIDDNGNGAKA